MKFFADAPEAVGLPFWQRPLGPAGIAEALLICRVVLGAESADWLVLGAALGLGGVAIVGWWILAERRAARRPLDEEPT